jgi:hypothetical protein
MNTRRELASVIGRALMEQPWVRRKDTWYLERQLLINLVNLQKSPFGGQFYINLGIFIKCDATVNPDDDPTGRFRARNEEVRTWFDYERLYPKGNYPLENYCDIGWRLELVVDNRPELDLALNLEDARMTGEQRANVISQALKTHALPVLESIHTISDVEQAYRSGLIAEWFVVYPLREWLDELVSRHGGPS